MRVIEVRFQWAKVRQKMALGDEFAHFVTQNWLGRRIEFCHPKLIIKNKKIKENFGRRYCLFVAQNDFWRRNCKFGRRIFLKSKWKF